MTDQPDSAADVISRRPGLPRPIPRATLVDAVCRQTSWRGVLRDLGFTGSRTGTVLRQICDELGIDYSHFAYGRVEMRQLARVITDATGWDQVLAELGYAQHSGSARATVRKHCRQAGIDVAHLHRERMTPAVWPLLVPQVANLRAAGPHLVAAALTMVGCAVSPAAEGLIYDLIADIPTCGMRRVQVKTTSLRTGSSWSCTLTRNVYSPDGGGRHRKAPYSAEEIDFFGCVSAEGDVYLIPISAVEGMSAITLARYERFRVPSLAEPPPPAES